MSDAILTAVISGHTITLTIPAERQFDVLDAHASKVRTEQDERWLEAQRIAAHEIPKRLLRD